MTSTRATSGTSWSCATPDNIQLEFFLMKADPATFIAAAEAVV